MVDIADLQYHPFPDSKFANKFEAAFSELNCIPLRYEAVVDDIDDNLSKFEIDLEDDDLNNLDLMPPPLFSRTNIPSLYKCLPPSPSCCGRVANKSYKQNTGLI